MLTKLCVVSTLISLSLASTVSTPYGEVEGIDYTTPTSESIDVFLGLRYGQYAKRFTKASLVDQWHPAKYDAKQFGAACFPFHERIMLPGSSEDCLFLNIMTPSSRKEKLPVLVYIHGGGFSVGFAAQVGYKKISDVIASQGVVVVAIQYRLGPFGFISLGDSTAPGNIGLWDQTLALRFVNEVISSFGGDPTRITVAGHSAGSSSASALQFAPASQDLFSQSILFSGSIYSEYAQSNAVINESISLAKELECFHEGDSLKTITCLQDVSPHNIMAAVERIGSSRAHPNCLKFHPLLDGDFFPDQIASLAKTAMPKNTLSGFTNQDSALFAMYYRMNFLVGTGVPENEQKNYTRKVLVDFIEKVIVTDQEHGSDAPTFRRLLTDFYVKKGERKDDPQFYLTRYIELLTDLQFLIPTYRDVQLKAANGWKSWIYVMDHDGTKSYGRDQHPVTGAYHGDELRYFTDHGLLPAETDDDDRQFEKVFNEMIVNFVKTGDPSLSTLRWPPVSTESPLMHAALRASPVIRREFRAEAARLWLKDVPKAVDRVKLGRSRLPGFVIETTHTEL